MIAVYLKYLVVKGVLSGFVGFRNVSKGFKEGRRACILQVPLKGITRDFRGVSRHCREFQGILGTF